MVLFERDIAIDIGTDETLVYVRGKGIMMREPTIVAVDKESGEVLRYGIDAQKMLGRTPANITAIHPIQSGVISDYDMTALFLQNIVSSITSFSLFKPRILVCVPGSITGVEERALLDACIEAGARRVYLVESAVAAAVGAGIDVNKPDGHMMIDIGAGTTEIAVVTLGSTAVADSIKIAGNAFDEAIVKFVRKKYNMLIGRKTAEEIKCEIGKVYVGSDLKKKEIRGRDLLTGLPVVKEVTSDDVAEAIKEPLSSILDRVHLVLERTAPELVGDVSTNGIVITGGGSQLGGMDKLITSKTGIEAVLVDDPTACSAYGAGKMLIRLNSMKDGMINFARRKQMQQTN